MSTITLTCGGCGKQFVVPFKKRDHKFCSLDCAYRVRRHASVDKACVVCQQPFTVPYQLRHHKVCSKECLHTLMCSRRHTEAAKSLISEAHRGRPTWNKGKTAADDSRILAGERSPTYGLHLSVSPETAAKISATHKARGTNVGDKNGMKKPDARRKISATRKRMMQDPLARRKISEAVSKAWADGKFEHARVGQCDWYDVPMSDGRVLKVQGTWERNFALWADIFDIPIIAHEGRFPYFDDQGVQHWYYPDFYLPEMDFYVDIKADYFMELQQEKFDRVYLANPGLRLFIFNQYELTAMGVLVA